MSSMYQTCPKCGHQREQHDTTPLTECAACGIVFEKWLRANLRTERARTPVSRPWSRHGWPSSTMQRVLYVEAKQDPLVIGVRAAVWLALCIWGAWFISTDHRVLSFGYPEINGSFMHRIDLVFHEAGHVIFMPFGRFIATLGGTLGQLLVPLVIMLAFIFKYANTFGGSVGLWWLGQSMLDVAPYVHDAYRQQMILLGGVTGRDRPGYHDWNYLLGQLGALGAADTLATLIDLLGTVLLLTGLIWGGYLLYRQWQLR